MKCRKFEYPSAQRGQFNAGVLKEVCKTLRNLILYILFRIIKLDFEIFYEL